MNDFESVVRLDDSLLPSRPWKDIEIPLDGYALDRHFEVSQKRGDGESVGNLANFSVNGNVHGNRREA
jgi:hypothetical protein